MGSYLSKRQQDHVSDCSCYLPPTRIASSPMPRHPINYGSHGDNKSTATRPQHGTLNCKQTIISHQTTLYRKDEKVLKARYHRRNREISSKT